MTSHAFKTNCLIKSVTSSVSVLKYIWCFYICKNIELTTLQHEIITETVILIIEKEEIDLIIIILHFLKINLLKAYRTITNISRQNIKLYIRWLSEIFLQVRLNLWFEMQWISKLIWTRIKIKQNQRDFYILSTSWKNCS